jgi:Replication initiation factor.
MAEAHILDEQAAGSKLEDYGFSGYRGFQCGDIRWGWGKDGALVVVSQELSHYLAPQLAKLADHWSRIDYCVTVFDIYDQLAPDEDYWQKWHELTPSGRGPVAMLRHQGFRTGSTITLGSRASASHLRVYDKYAESKGDYARGCWRWELELKREMSEAAQQSWRANYVSADLISAIVAEYPGRYGLNVPWGTSASYGHPGLIRRKRDADRLLTWFSTQVAPSVQWVAQARGRDAVRNALQI